MSFFSCLRGFKKSFCVKKWIFTNPRSQPFFGMKATIGLSARNTPRTNSSTCMGFNSFKGKFLLKHKVNELSLSNGFVMDFYDAKFEILS
jgi:hypothetical protein